MYIEKQFTASFDVDAQNGFTPLCPDELPVPDGDKIVYELNEQAKFCSVRVGSKDWHPKNALWIADSEQPQFSKILNAPNIDIRWNSHCIGGTYGSKLIDGLPHPKDYDFFVWKGMEPDMHPYSACYHDLEKKLSTGVIEFLKYKKINTIILSGLALDYCCLATAEDLIKAGFIVIFNKAGCREIGKNDVYSRHLYIPDSSFLRKPYLTTESDFCNWFLKYTSTKKLGLDLHGVITEDRQYWSTISKILIELYNCEIHIITGKSFKKVGDEIKDFPHTHFYSITDYEESVGTPIKYDELGNPHMDENIWNSSKARYCNRNKIDVHVDDSEIYGKCFDSFFPLGNATMTKYIKWIGKDSIYLPYRSYK